jgi:hypothetical protein
LTSNAERVCNSGVLANTIPVPLTQKLDTLVPTPRTLPKVTIGTGGGAVEKQQHKYDLKSSIFRPFTIYSASLIS